jgi:hypothetical protein
MKRTAVWVALIALVLGTGSAHASQNETISGDGDVRVVTDEATWTLSNERIAIGWSASDAHLHRTRLEDRVTNENLTSSPISDFSFVLDGVQVQESDLALRSATAEALPHGISLHFAFDPAPIPLLVPQTFWVERTETLYSGTGLVESNTVIHNDTPTVHILISHRLEQNSGSPRFPSVEVQRYVGGSDWRDDFRTTAVISNGASFDREGEVARFDEGTVAEPAGGGFFIVTERRGGIASRVGNDGSTMWAGADYARDLLDAGPLLTDPPDYNRVDNPVYPVPIRARRVYPLSDLRLGRAAIGVYHGGAEQAGFEYGTYLAKYREPAFRRQVLLNSFHPWSHGDDYNETTIQKQADLAAPLGIDTIILDDQWQGGASGESGDWQWDADPASVDGDPARFPKDADGRAYVIDYLKDRGLKLGLWMSPAEFTGQILPYGDGQIAEKAADAFLTHPHWACRPIGTATSQVPSDVGLGVWDFTNPDLRVYMTSVIDRIVKDWGVTYFKFDFQAWVDCPPHDYNDYEDAFVGWVDSLLATYPEVTFTFDETNDQRMYAFESAARGPSWFDNAHSHTLPGGARVSAASQILHDVWSASPWIPPSTLGVGLYDGTLETGLTPDYLMPMATLTHMTFWKDLTKLTPSQFADTQWWLAWYHAHAAELGGSVYRLTGDDADPWDDQQPAIFQPWDRDTDSGFLYAFRQTGAQPVPALRGLVPGHSYTLTNIRTGAVLGTFSAESLRWGVSLPTMPVHAAAVYSVVPN